MQVPHSPISPRCKTLLSISSRRNIRPEYFAPLWRRKPHPRSKTRAPAVRPAPPARPQPQAVISALAAVRRIVQKERSHAHDASASRDSTARFDRQTGGLPFRHAIDDLARLQPALQPQLARRIGHPAKRPAAISDDFLASRQLMQALFEFVERHRTRARQMRMPVFRLRPDID